MIEIGYSLSSEEHTSKDLVRQAVAAEQAGFGFLGISDHFHPWLDSQGYSPFVWSVLGAIAASTERVQIGTMVTCPMIRTHPAIIAQAAATMGDLMPGRFSLGLGSGENLNEHIVGEGWPRAQVRLEMLEEATEIIRELWGGSLVSYDGAFYTVENARIYTLPEQLPPIYFAAAGPDAATLAGRIGEGIIATSPDAELVTAFKSEGNDGPRLGKLTVCIAESEDEGVRIAHKIWPNSTLKGAFKLELPLPSHFEEATANTTPEQVAEAVLCSRDPQKHIEAIREFEDAGYTRVYVHQVGPDQQRFLDFYMNEVIPGGS